MRANETPVWLKQIALLLIFTATSAVAVSAQTTQGSQPGPEAVLVPGTSVWITDSSGREEKTRIVDVSPGIVTGAVGENIRHLRTTDIVRVRARHTDSVLNGALIGAGAGVVSGLFLCRLTEPWENCGNGGPLLRIGALGAGVGIGIDALIRGRKTIYEAGRGSAHLSAAPIIGTRVRGLQISVTF